MSATLRTAIGAAAGLTLLAGAACAQGDLDKATKTTINARQSLMDLYSFNLALLGDMAKGKIDYDGEAATGAAASIVALSSVDQSRMWPEGSDVETHGKDVTHAKAAIWNDMDDFMSHVDDLHAAATKMEGAAGESLEALRGNMKALGDACGACHDDYRASFD